VDALAVRALRRLQVEEDEGNSMRSVAALAGAALLIALPTAARAGAKIEITEDRYVTLGVGVRTSFTAAEDGAPSRDDFSNDFDLESFRLYTGGQLSKNLAAEFNAEYNGDQEVRVLDGLAKLNLGEKFNIWAGRFLPPSDRANLSGPYYLNSFDFPFVQQYPAIFAGRDEGAAYWGQVGEGKFKWQFGAFEGDSTNSDPEGSNEDGDLLYSGRLTLNFWDPEPGYYNSSTYYGDKNILAIGLVGMYQNDGASRVIMPDTAAPDTQSNAVIDTGDFTGWNVDFLLERKLDAGVFTLEGAYYDYDRDDNGNVFNEGDGYFGVVSFLFPGEFGVGDIKAKLQPLIRYQLFDPEIGAAEEHGRFDFGLNFIIDQHNTRLSLIVSRDEDSPTGTPGVELDNRTIFKLGLQIQL
jgi:hypothetical protein